MPDVFVNYRTGDGEKTAATIERELSHRFGEQTVFRASKSIKPGERYPDELLGNVRRSAVVLAVIGPDWSSSPALRHEGDWVRKEILEAFACGIPVIPVIDGRKTERLDGANLPPELAQLADIQSFRLDTQDLQAGLARIADRLTTLVPELKDRTAARPPASSGVENRVDEVHGTAVQSRDITGDVGSVVKGLHGNLQMGKGDQYNNSQHFSGAGVNNVHGDVNGGVHQRFGSSRRDEDDHR